MKLIYETTEVESTQEINESTGSKKYIIKGIFSTPETKNKNGRVYPMHIWESEVRAYQDVLKNGSSNSLMELNHPPRTSVDMMEAVARMRKLYIKDRKVYGEAILLDNPKANQLKTLIDNGIKMSVSSRGVGSLDENRVKEYKLITFDVIPNQDQSDYNAEMYGITEGVLMNEDFKIDESGNIHKVCDEDGVCTMFESKEVSQAVLEKFNTVLGEISKVNLSERRVNIQALYDELEDLTDAQLAKVFAYVLQLKD